MDILCSALVMSPDPVICSDPSVICSTEHLIDDDDMLPYK